MPYIRPSRRPAFDTIIDGIINQARLRPAVQKTRDIVFGLTTGFVGLPLPADYNCVENTLASMVRDLVKRIQDEDGVRGDVNYSVCRIALESLKPATGWSYYSLSDAVAACEGAAAEIAANYDFTVEWRPIHYALSICVDAGDEIRRRLLAPYEDAAIIKNGDMACFQEPFAHVPLSFLPECEEDSRHMLAVIEEEDDLGPIPSYVGDPLPAITDAFTDDQIEAIEKERDVEEAD